MGRGVPDSNQHSRLPITSLAEAQGYIEHLEEQLEAFRSEAEAQQTRWLGERDRLDAVAQAVEALWVTRITTGETAIVNTRELTDLHKLFRDSNPASSPRPTFPLGSSGRSDISATVDDPASERDA